MTPHIEAKKEEIAKYIIMPGDPLRAQKIAYEYLENPVLVNDVRNVLAYTGTYKGVPVTIFASGMGNASMGIYSYELYRFYDAEVILRIGSAGAYQKELNLYDLVLVQNSYSDSSYAKVQSGSDLDTLKADEELNDTICTTAKKLEYKIHKGTIYCTDVFYKKEDNYKQLAEQKNCLACEMETFSLFANARELKKKAGCILTISNSFVTGEETTSEERQNAFQKMMVLALEAIADYDRNH